MKNKLLFSLALFAAALASAGAEPVTKNYARTIPAPGMFRFRWYHGAICPALDRSERIQVQRYNEDTYVMRMNMDLHHEAPFMYLLMGNDRAILIDTGAMSDPKLYPLRATVDALIAQWCDLRGKADLPLIVAFTSAEDLVQNQGYEQFKDRPNTTLVPKALPELKKFYGVDAAWPGGLGKLDLGGRVLTVIPTPGAHIDGITFYDPYNNFLYTGDFLFPGRIMISNEKDYAASIKRLKGVADRFPVKWVMGGQIEMTNLPGVDYSRMTYYRPAERVLEMNPSVIAEAQELSTAMMFVAGATARTDFIMMNKVGIGYRNIVRPAELGAPGTLAGAGLR